jgi:hypothetical protein
MANPLIVMAAEGSSEGGVSPWFVGIGIFVLLGIVLLGLLVFGAGREHS